MIACRRGWGNLRRSCWLAIVVALLPACVSLAQERRGAFTAPPRSVRSRDIDQQHVRLELKFDFDQQTIGATATHRLKTFKPLRTIKLDAAELQIQQVTLRGGDDKAASQELAFSLRGDELSIDLPREVPAEEEVVLTIAYRIERPKHGAHFVVPDDSEPDQPRMVWTQSEPEYARYWYPCFDSPSDRLTSEIIATVPQDFFVLSNGTLVHKSEPDNGQRTWHWSQTKSHVPYLLSVVAGDFEAYEQQWDGIPVISYVPRGRLAEAPRSFEKTPAMMDYFSRAIGVRYPWEKYAQICVDEYAWGGMEHTSATTLNLGTLHDERAHHDVSSDNLVAHELAHQWWGDLLTCKDWGELWLNESFATYFATLWTEHDKGWDEAAWQRRAEANSYLDEDQRYRRPIVTYRYPRPQAMFDRHSYPKGGRVLHMLRFVLGDDLYWRSLRRYAEVNQHRTVETADLRSAIEDATGQGLNWFFDQWVYHGGHPEFDVRWTWDDAAQSVVLTVKQTQKVDDLTPLFRMPVEIEIGHGSAAQTRRLQVSKAEETFHFALEQRPKRVVFDPRDWILKRLKCDKPKEEWLDQLAHTQHVVARAEAIAGLAAYKEHKDVRAALLKAASDDPFWGVRQEAVKMLADLNGDDVRQKLQSIARDDPRSQVRREALEGLAKFAHDDVKQTLREAIAGDPSYYAVAEALRALTKIDREHVADDLLKALDTPGHQQVILKAACDGLVDLKEERAIARLQKMLEGKLRPEERVVVIGALARLKADDEAVLALLKKEIDNDRAPVRRAAIDTLASLGRPESLDWLREKRQREETPGMVRTLDEAIRKLEEAQKEKSLTEVKKEVDELRKANRALQERLQKLEENKQAE